MYQYLFLLLTGAVLLSLCFAWVRSFREALPDGSGWVSIRPAPTVYAIVTGGTGFAVLLLYASLFAEPSSHDPNDWIWGTVCALCFMVVAILILFLSHWPKVSWRNGRIRVISFWGRSTEFRYNDLRRVVFRRSWGAFDLHFVGPQKLQILVMTKGSRELFSDLGDPDLEYA